MSACLLCFIQRWKTTPLIHVEICGFIEKTDDEKGSGRMVHVCMHVWVWDGEDDDYTGKDFNHGGKLIRTRRTNEACG